MLCFDEIRAASMPASSRSASSRALSNGGDAASAFANDCAVGLSVMISSLADLARSKLPPHSSVSKRNCRHSPSLAKSLASPSSSRSSFRVSLYAVLGLIFPFPDMLAGTAHAQYPVSQPRQSGQADRALFEHHPCQGVGVLIHRRLVSDGLKRRDLCLFAA